MLKQEFTVAEKRLASVAEGSFQKQVTNLMDDGNKLEASITNKSTEEAGLIQEDVCAKLALSAAKALEEKSVDHKVGAEFKKIMADKLAEFKIIREKKASGAIVNLMDAWNSFEDQMEVFFVKYPELRSDEIATSSLEESAESTWTPEVLADYLKKNEDPLMQKIVDGMGGLDSACNTLIFFIAKVQMIQVGNSADILRFGTGFRDAIEALKKGENFEAAKHTIFDLLRASIFIPALRVAKEPAAVLLSKFKEIMRVTEEVLSTAKLQPALVTAPARASVGILRTPRTSPDNLFFSNQAAASPIARAPKKAPVDLSPNPLVPKLNTTLEKLMANVKEWGSVPASNMAGLKRVLQKLNNIRNHPHFDASNVAREHGLKYAVETAITRTEKLLNVHKIKDAILVRTAPYRGGHPKSFHNARELRVDAGTREMIKQDTGALLGQVDNSGRTIQSGAVDTAIQELGSITKSDAAWARLSNKFRNDILREVENAIQGLKAEKKLISKWRDEIGSINQAVTGALNRAAGSTTKIFDGLYRNLKPKIEASIKSENSITKAKDALLEKIERTRHMGDEVGERLRLTYQKLAWDILKIKVKIKF